MGRFSGTLALLCLVPAWPQSTAATPPADQTVAALRTQPVKGPPDSQSLDRIKRALAELPALPPNDGALPRGPVFRTQVVETRRATPTVRDSIVVDWQPVQPGMLYHQELLNMVTRPEFRPYAVFTTGELVQVTALTLKSHLLFSAAKGAVRVISQAIRQGQVARVRRQIEHEISAIERAKLEANKESVIKQ